MDIIIILIKFCMNIFRTLVPVLSIPLDFLENLDNSMSSILLVFNQADYFLPLNVMFSCLGAVLVVANWLFVVSKIRWIMSIIRG